MPMNSITNFAHRSGKHLANWQRTLCIALVCITSFVFLGGGINHRQTVPERLRVSGIEIVNADGAVVATLASTDDGSLSVTVGMEDQQSQLLITSSKSVSHLEFGRNGISTIKFRIDKESTTCRLESPARSKNKPNWIALDSTLADTSIRMSNHKGDSSSAITDGVFGSHLFLGGTDQNQALILSWSNGSGKISGAQLEERKSP